MVKSNKWPTGNKEIANDGNKGFVDPATEEYDKHIERNEQGYICGKTLLGRNICENLNFHIRRTDLYWKIHSLYKIQEKLEEVNNINTTTLALKGVSKLIQKGLTLSEIKYLTGFETKKIEDVSRWLMNQEDVESVINNKLNLIDI